MSEKACTLCGGYGHSVTSCPWTKSASSTVGDIKPLLSPWMPTQDVRELKTLGKLGEELGECSSAANRAIIQQITECEPVTKKPNKLWLEEELADVRATSRLAISEFSLDEAFIEDRSQRKEAQLRQWLAMQTA